MVCTGDATGLATSGLLSPVTGVQLYVAVTRVDAARRAEPPTHINESGEAITEGDAFTSTLTESFAEQPNALWATTIYCVLACGLATGLAPVVSERLVAGCHCHVLPVPLVASVTDVPLHMAVSGMVAMTGRGFTCTVTEELLL